MDFRLFYAIRQNEFFKINKSEGARFKAEPLLHLLLIMTRIKGVGSISFGNASNWPLFYPMSQSLIAWLVAVFWHHFLTMVPSCFSLPPHSDPTDLLYLLPTIWAFPLTLPWAEFIFTLDLQNVKGGPALGSQHLTTTHQNDLQTKEHTKS